MASPVTVSRSSTGSADSYIGCLLSIVSKSEMRYEGVLYYINPRDATFGLQNVRSYGTEGRRKDGPQVLPDERVFEYIQFRGSDIKDLQVFPSPAPQDTSSVLDDPAIIQSHYIPPAATSTSASYTASVGIANLTSAGGLQNSVTKDSFPSFPPVRNLESMGTLMPPPGAQVNASALISHVQGFEGPSSGISPYVQQQSFIGRTQGLAALYPVKQQMQYPAFNSPIANSTLNLEESSHSLMLPVARGSLILTPNLISSSVFPLNSTSLSSLVTPYVVPHSKPESLPTVTLSPDVPSLSPVTAAVLERSSIMPQVFDKSNSVLVSEESKSSNAVPGKVVKTGPAECSSSRSFENVCEDVEVVKSLTSESRPTYSKYAQASLFPLPTAPAKKGLIQPKDMVCSSKKPQKLGGGHKKTGAKAPTHNYVKSDSAQMWKKKDVAYTPAREISKISSEKRGQKDVTDPRIQENMRASSKERGTKNPVSYQMNRRSSQTNKKRENYARKGGKKMLHSTKFSEDFDFEAMNEKFNKNELWGELGKRMMDRLEGQVNEGEKDARGEAVVNLDIRPVYIKDEFFDSLSSDKSDHKLSEWSKIDKETFGDFKILQNRGTQRVGRGVQFKGSNDGRGYGNAGRGRGRGKVQAAWSRVVKVTESY